MGRRPSILERKLRFSTAAFAIGASQTTLRNWLERGQVKLSDQSPEGWREFTFADIAILAVVRKLVGFGLRVREANELAQGVIVGSRFLRHLKDEPPEALVAAWRDSLMTVYRGANGWIYKFSPIDDTDVPRHANGNRVNAILTLDVASLLEIAFERAARAPTSTRFA